MKLVKQRLCACELILFAICALTLVLVACGDDGESGDQGIQCPSGTVWDPVQLACLRDDLPDAGFDATEDAANDAGDDIGEEDTTPDMPDTTEDVGEDIDPACDMDGDGDLSLSCGGGDCDDDNALVSSLNIETCDEIDNNCNDVVNEGIECVFFAHDDDNLYRVDPFRMTATQVTTVPELYDIDTHPDGTLYGVTADRVYRFDDERNDWFIVGQVPEFEDATGLAIDSGGVGYVTSEDQVFTIDLSLPEATLLGNMGDFYSSGDCVVNKSDTMFMTSKDFEQDDTLVMISRSTGVGQAVGPDGGIGFRSVYGLTAGWGNLFGLTRQGHLIRIDPQTGAGTLLHTFEGIGWAGAASNPSR